MNPSVVGNMHARRRAVIETGEEEVGATALALRSRNFAQ
jgi:hypothetical protein